MCAHAIVEVVSNAQRDAVVALARQIWFEHYPGIISFAQIHYMLEQGYTRGVVEEEQRAGISWHMAEYGGAPIGFVAFGPVNTDMKVYKVYVLRDAKGKGIGRALMDVARRAAAATGCKGLVLTVNKNNLDSIRAYIAMGYSFTTRVCASIGHGFVMDDYVMRLDIVGAGSPANR